MSAAVNDNKVYERLIKRFPLRPIRDDEHNAQAAEMCDVLVDRIDSLSEAERDYLEVLTDLIAKYESKWDNDCSDMTPLELIIYLMKQNNLAQKDLIPEFGSPSRVSEFLKGERRLSLEQAKRLAERFRLNIAALIAKDELPQFAAVVSTGNKASIHDSQTPSLKKLLEHSQPISYELFFQAFTNIANEEDNYVLQLLQRPIEEENFSTAYCNLFNEINFWLIAIKSSRNTTQCSVVSEGVDVDSYMAFLRPEYMAWENAIRKGSRQSRWLRRHSVTTYGDFLRQLRELAEPHIHTHHAFWARSINPEDGQIAYERFAIDLYEELSGLAQKKR